jgi:hypothetical protein
MAVAVEDHQDICYVGHDKSVQRRAVKVAQAPPPGDMLEVLDRLSEGEEVFLAPALLASSAPR